MSQTIDSKIVEARFDNAQFLKGIDQTLKGLGDLNKGIEKVGSAKGLGDLNAQANRVDLSQIGAQADQVASRFSAMGVAATAALATMASMATRTGIEMGKSLGLGAVTEGWGDYNLKIGATQTIMAGTGESIGVVGKHLKELDVYADETIYSLSDMVSNMGKFTNAGVKLPVAVQAMKGISNVAAISGASAGEASRAMYNLGQAIGQGTVRLMDWRSVELANMGTKEFKEQLIQSGEAMGTLTRNAKGNLQTVEGTEVTYKNFTASLQDQWLTAEALTKTLENYADKNTDIGKRAYKAAKDVKTLSMMLETTKAAMGTGWTDTFEILVGDLPEATKLWTRVSEVIGGAIGRSADARNKLLGDWDKLGGRKMLIQGLANAFRAVSSWIQPLREGFREIFPKATAEGLYNATVAFRDFWAQIKMGPETIESLKWIFAGFFAVIKIGWEVVKGVIGVFSDLLGIVGSGSGGFLALAGGVGEFLVNLQKLVTEGEILTVFFDGLSEVLGIIGGALSAVGQFVKEVYDAFRSGDATPFKNALIQLKLRFQNLMKVSKPVAEFFRRIGDAFDDVRGEVESFVGEIDLLTRPMQLLKDFGKWIGDFFSKLNPKGAIDPVSNQMGRLGDKLGFIDRIGRGVVDFFRSIPAAFDGFGATISDALGVISQAIQDALTPENLKKGLQLLIAGAATAFLWLLKRLKDGVTLGLGDIAKSVNNVLGEVTNTLKTMQLEIKADAILKIAAALGILVLSLVVLSTMDAKELLKSLTAMAAGMYILVKGLGTMVSTFGPTQALKLIAISASFTILAAGILVLSTALKVFATLDSRDLGKTFIALAGSLWIMQKALGNMADNEKDVIKGSAALLILGIALTPLAVAMKIMGTLDGGDVAAALVAIAGGLTAMVAALKAMPDDALSQAGALVAVSIAINILAVALAAMGVMSWDMINKGLTTLGASLLIMALGLQAMKGTQSGALALMLAAAALNLFLIPLVALAHMPWQVLVGGLLAIVAILGTLGLTAFLLTPVIPVLIGLGTALVFIGAGMALAGLGAIQVATAFAIFAAAAVGSIAVLDKVVGTFITSIPAFVEAVGEGFVRLIKKLAEGGEELADFLGTVLEAFSVAIIEAIPELSKAFWMLFDELMKVMTEAIPRINDAFVTMLIKLFHQMKLKGPILIEQFSEMVIALADQFTEEMPELARSVGDWFVALFKAFEKEIPDVLEAGTDAAVKFLEGLGDNAEEMADAAFNFIIDLIEGLTTAIENNSEELREAGRGLGEAIVSGIVGGMEGGKDIVSGIARSMGLGAVASAAEALESKSPSRAFYRLGRYATQGFALGLTGGREEVGAAWDTMRELMKDAYASTAEDVKRYEDRLHILRNTDEINQLERDLKRLNKIQHKTKQDYADIAQVKRQLTRARDVDTAAIRRNVALLVKARSEHSRTTQAIRELNRDLDDEQRKLFRLSIQYDAYTERLDAANQKLKEAIAARRDYNMSIRGQYNVLPELDADSVAPVSEYIKDLKYEVAEVNKITEVMAKLRDLGLSDDVYRDILSKGTDALPFAERLLEQGAGAVKQVNTLAQQLKDASTELGNDAATELYQAGVDSAQGLVDGIRARRAALVREMRWIALAIVGALRAELKMQSPSRVMQDLGELTALGLARGLERSNKVIYRASTGLGKSAVEAMSKSISTMSSLGLDDMTLNPTITPVLDLSTVRRDATGLQSLLDARLSVADAYSKAQGISSSYRANQVGSTTRDDISAPSLSYTQNNYSPKALSKAEVYRNTKNQLSTVKGALTNATPKS